MMRFVIIQCEKTRYYRKMSMGHADRATPARCWWYLRELMLPIERRSVGPTAARVHLQNVQPNMPIKIEVDCE